ncbi:MAG: hypothetical protein J0J14_00860 [Hyphomicrobium sp.]|nr:hypothetical protein [Hyphomicrobium sp.]
MKKTLMAAAFALAGAGFGLTSQANAAVFAPGQGASLNGQSIVIDVQRGDWRDGRRGPPPRMHSRGYRPDGYGRWHRNHLVQRRWHRRPYYGTIVGGIAIGALLAGSAYYAYSSAPPAPGLCWYWADPYERQGYWDYC